MYQSQEKRAWNRGVRFAGIWKRARTTLLNWINGVCRGRLLIVYRLGVGISQ